jgi:hypothetical protein
MNNLKQAAVTPKTFGVAVYHVIDVEGTHRFLALPVDDLGGAEAVAAMLASQWKKVELLGTATVATSPDNPARWELVDRPDEENLLSQRLARALDSCPNSSLECFLPNTTPAPNDARQVKLRPMSTLQKKDLGRIAITFTNRDVCSMVKPEFVSIVRARGGARLDEFREEFRRILEPSLLREIEAPTPADQQSRRKTPNESEG